MTNFLDKKLIYFLGKDDTRDLLLFSACINNKHKISNTESMLKFINDYKIPKFPISGDYLKEHGYETGKVLGDKLKLLKEKWIENNFALDEKLIKKFLKNN